MTRRANVTRDDRIFSLSSHASPAMSIPMDDDNRSMKWGLYRYCHSSSGESSPTHKMKRNRKKKSMYGEDDYEWAYMYVLFLIVQLYLFVHVIIIMEMETYDGSSNRYYSFLENDRYFAISFIWAIWFAVFSHCFSIRF